MAEDKISGNDIRVEALRQQGVEHAFFLAGAPMIAVENACEAAGIRMIDVRHEQAAAMAAHAYARVLRRRHGVRAVVVLLHQGGVQSEPGGINDCNGMEGEIVEIV